MQAGAEMGRPATYQPGRVALPPRSKRFSKDEMEDPGSTLVIRNVVVLNKRTSLRMEPEMWDALNDVARREGHSLHDICTRIVECKPGGASLTAAIRVFLVNYYRMSSTEDGHREAGHGVGDPDIIGMALAPISRVEEEKV
jgi:predicted DNA-binding ribbon-helix-helix protein